MDKVESVHDYHQIYFDNGGVMSIYNPFSVLRGGNSVGLELLANLKLERVDVDDGRKISLKFYGDIELIIDIDEKSFSGPEALELQLPGEPIMVWN